MKKTEGPEKKNGRNMKTMTIVETEEMSVA
jgi:hypothetical protein